MSIFMSYEGVPGEASDSPHKNWIDISDLKWGVGRKITSHTGTRDDRESANAEITDLTLTRCMDSASPYLSIESCCGRGKTVVIHLTKTGAGSGADVFMEYTLRDAMISCYRTKAVSQSDIRPRELLKISFVDKEAHLLFRNAPDEGVLALAMRDKFDIGGESSIAIVSHLATQWFAVNVSAHEWLFDIHELAGRFARLRISGGSVGNIDDARVSIDLSVNARFNESGHALRVRGIPVIDGSLSLATFEIGAELERVDAEKIIVYDADGSGHYQPTSDSLQP